MLDDASGLVPTRMSALALAEAIRHRRITASAVVAAHVAVLREAQPRTNSLAVPRFDAVLAEAEAADGLVAATDPVRGHDHDQALPPMLGVPCTIKEMIGVAGMPHTAGLACRGGHRATTTATAAQRLLDAGAVVLGLTNVAELGIWIESKNSVYGLTRNAYDQARTAGGSSGGEGVAVGVGGSPVGLGSDMGGSVRLPAFFNGVFGHKPSSGLVPNTGMFPDGVGEVGRLLTIGHLTRRAADLMPILRIIAGPDGTDPFVKPLALGDPADVSIDELSVVVSEETSYLPPAHEIRYARERAVSALAAAGADVRRVPLRSVRRATAAFLATASEVGGSLEDLIVRAGAPPVTLRSVLQRSGRHNLMTLLAIAGERLPRSERFVQRTIRAGAAVAEEISATIGDGILLHPPFARTAPRHHRTTARPWLQTPCSVFNLAGLPATQVPLGLSNRGLPLGVQVVANHGRDHLTVAVAHYLEQALGGWVPPSRSIA